MLPLASSLTPLSSSYRWSRFVFPPLLYVAISADLFSSDHIVYGTWLMALLAAPFIWLLYRQLDSSFATAYDAGFFYLYQKTGTEQIPLGSIYQIKYIFFKTGSRHRWRIEYYDAQGQPQSVQLLPLGFSGRNIDGFIIAVRRHNPQVAVRHWSFSFD